MTLQRMTGALRQVFFRIPHSTYDRLELEARFRGMTVGMLAERVVIDYARTDFSTTDEYMIAMHRDGFTVKQIAARLDWMVERVRKAHKRLHLIPNPQ